jgi:GT2 family glycosyltransferase
MMRKASKKPWISVIIPTREHPEMLAKCMKSLAAAVKKSKCWIEIIVIDGDDDPEPVQKVLRAANLDEVNYTVAEGWWNFSRINNHAASLTSGEYLLLLNDDCFVPPTFFDDLGQLSDDEILGFLLIYEDKVRIQHAGIDIIQNCQPVNMGLAIPWPNYSASPRTRVTGVSMACCLVPRRVFDALGGLDVDYNFGLEDVDFSLRAWENGYRVTMCNDIKCVHVGNVSGHLMTSLSPRNSPLYNFQVFHKKWLQSGRLSTVVGLVGDGDRTENRA